MVLALSIRQKHGGGSKTKEQGEESALVIHIETVDLSLRGVTLPSDRVGMVIAQPYLSLTATEPYRCTPETKARQLAVLTETLAVARAARHGAPKTHFTVCPEYSIPGLDGIAHVDTAIRAADWPNGTIVIGGTDALTKADLATVAGAQGTYLSASLSDLTRIAQNEWINCAVTWVKAADGTVARWLQPKLHPAWPEQNIHCQGMFRGNSVFTFKGPLDNETQYRFCSLVCFDWIATLNSRKAWRWVLEDLRRQAAEVQAELSLSWLFVIQCNPKPSHDSFLTEVVGFFDQTTLPNVRRDRACLVFSPQTLFAEPTCPATFCSGGPRFRSSTLLSAHRDVLFRERGACIHSFLQVNPNSLSAGPAGKTLALENAFVFPLDGTADRRAPGGTVPACIKWLNDELDDLPSLGTRYPTAALAAQANTTHQRSIVALRAISPQSATHAVKLAAQESNAHHADDWDRTEAEALEHLVHTLDIISIGFPQSTVDADPAHAAVVMNNQPVDLLAIRGDTHEACIEHSKSFLPLPRRQVLLVSRDRDNTEWLQRFGSFLEPDGLHVGAERKFTSPSSGWLHLGYQKLLNIFRNAATAAAVTAAINDQLTA